MAGMQETDHITLKNGITYLLQDAKARAKLAELLVEVMEKYGADNPPPYPITSVNGQTGDVDIPTGNLPLSVQDGGTGATTSNLALHHLGVTIPDGWSLQFSYIGGAFNLDFVVSGSERYRLTWWAEGISYQALINGEWQTIWVK